MKSDKLKKVELLAPGEGAKGQKVITAWLPKAKVINAYFAERALKKASFSLKPALCGWCEKFALAKCLHCLNCGKVLQEHTELEHYLKSRKQGGSGVARV